MKQACFSVIILCYRHFEYLHSAIDSVLQQDYENIELIVSDDGSENFPQKAIEEYIEANKGSNITHVLVRQEETNHGTVRHLNHAIATAQGEYLIALAGDDAFYDSTVLLSFAEGFLRAAPDCYIEMAQTGMYDIHLKRLEEYYVKRPVQGALEKAESDTSELLYMLLRCGACLPSTSTCFRREFFREFGPLDEHYTLTEDYPMHIRLAKEGWKIHYENFVAIKHRHGGISHGQKGASSKSMVLYFSDLKQAIQSYILPNIGVLSPEDQKFVRQFQKKQLLWIDNFLYTSQKKYGKILLMGLKHPCHGLEFGLKRISPVTEFLHKKLLALCLALWLLLPTLGQMAETVTAVPAKQFLGFLYPFTAVLFGVWCVTFTAWALNKVIKTIQHFPIEVIAIG